MSKLFDDGDSDDNIGIRTDNEFAKKYDTWRKKEELNKLKTKYGEDAIESSDDSSTDNEGLGELDEEDDKKFFKTLSCLIAKKDPGRIYDDESSAKIQKKKSTKKDQTMYLKDYERKLILEKGGQFSESEDEAVPNTTGTLTYVEEQRQLKDSLKGALNADSDSEDDEPFKPRKESATENTNDDDYTKWLAGQNAHLDDKQLEADLEPLKTYWNDPDLDEGEKFLRDYVLNKRYLEKDDENYCPRYDEIIHDSDGGLSEDEKELDKAEDFEYKYNFRFEEPDPEFIKTYPRTMQNSLRRTDDRRKIKRAETKERKQKEKQQKMDELKTLQKLKMEEIEEKITKLKEVTGNSDVGFNNEDIDGDFNPEDYDKRMQKLFDDEFYQGVEGDQKPEFPDLDEELEIENWNKWDGNTHDDNNEEQEINEPHCEDDNFNMDCDFDPHAAKEETTENVKGRKKRKRKSKFAEVLSMPKPRFDPNDKSYEEYLDEYYKLDCEDIIEDIPCRFKYRKVIPNSFGLTIEEILTANDRELNKWCSLKKTVQNRPEHVEKYDQIAYTKKAQNINLKKKIIPSLFSNENDFEESKNEPKKDEDNSNKCESKNNQIDKKSSCETNIETVKERNKSSIDNHIKRNKKKSTKTTYHTSPEITNNTVDVTQSVNAEKYKINKNEDLDNTTDTSQVLQVKPLGNNSDKKKKRKKRKKMGTVESNELETSISNARKNDSASKTKEPAKNRKRTFSKAMNPEQKNVKAKKAKKSKGKDVLTEISDARLTSFGYNPKKYKNTLKYKNK